MALSAVSQTDPTVALALREASNATGVRFDYLLNTAMRESALKPDATAQGSSAAGLFQFVESTWLGMVKARATNSALGNMPTRSSAATTVHCGFPTPARGPRSWHCGTTPGLRR